jgi:uncharacterized protein involved in type VI secretion and phage assembly
MGNSAKFFGKYRGTVVNNIDPLQICRIQALVPEVSNLTTWAMPCVPIAGQQMGSYFLPPVGAGVWIEFEQGDPDYPVWVGGYWNSAAEVPALAIEGAANIVLQTTGQNAIVVSDLPGPLGGIMLKSTNGATIVINDVGITIQNGKGASLRLIGPEVDINGGALTVI